MNRFGLAFAFAGALCLSSLLLFPGCHGAGGPRPIPCNASLSVFCANILYCDPLAEPRPAYIERRDRHLRPRRSLDRVPLAVNPQLNFLD